MYTTRRRTDRITFPIRTFRSSTDLIIIVGRPRDEIPIARNFRSFSLVRTTRTHDKGPPSSVRPFLFRRSSTGEFPLIFECRVSSFFPLVSHPLRRRSNNFLRFQHLSPCTRSLYWYRSNNGTRVVHISVGRVTRVYRKCARIYPMRHKHGRTISRPTHARARNSLHIIIISATSPKFDVVKSVFPRSRFVSRRVMSAPRGYITRRVIAVPRTRNAFSKTSTNQRVTTAGRMNVRVFVDQFAYRLVIVPCQADGTKHARRKLISPRAKQQYDRNHQTTDFLRIGNERNAEGVFADGCESVRF